ncbi:hypothetical protein WA158_006411 [Blastocystis sp. Blastoise]
MEYKADRYRAININDICEIRDCGDMETYKPNVIPKLFKKMALENPDHIAVIEANQHEVTFRDYWNLGNKFAKSLVANGLQPFDVVSAIGFNSLEYLTVLSSSSLAGCCTSGIYTTNSPEACFYVLNHCSAKIIVVEGEKQLSKIIEIRERLPLLKRIVVYNRGNLHNLPENKPNCATVCFWEDFIEEGKDVPNSVIDERVNNLNPGQCLTIIYTSGTTGNPKGAMLSHDNVIWTVEIVDKDLGLSTKDRLVSFLPLNHIAASMMDCYACILKGLTVYMAQSDALKGSLVKTLHLARPTIFLTVPRVFEKMMDVMKKKMNTMKGIKKILANWARRKSIKMMDHCQYGSKTSKPSFFGLCQKLVLNKVKVTLGLDQARILYSAAAPIDPETIRFFGNFDLHINELFGQSESCGPITYTKTNYWKIGTCGRAMSNSTVKLDSCSGELLAYGRNIFMGYLHMPDLTYQAIDNDGFVHTGDIASADSDGFYTITGRIKELIITAGGENIPPILIENEIRNMSNAISNVVLIGDKRKYLSILITLKCQTDPDSGRLLDDLHPEALEIMKQIGSPVTTLSAASDCPIVANYFTSILQDYNKVATSQAQKVQRFALLKHDFSLQTGELTPTLKLKRGAIFSMYSDVIEQLYQ